MGSSSSAPAPHWSQTEAAQQTAQQQQQQGLELIDLILEQYRSKIAADYQGYRNHCVRVYLYCVILSAAPFADQESYRKLAICLAFHDIGLWTAGTIDYLDPSRQVAMEYLDANNLSAWKDEVGEMMDRHHQILQADLAPQSLTNLVRLADLADFSWGWVSNGVPKSEIRKAQQQYPNAGFHRTLLRFTAYRMVTRPWNPAPMMRLR